MPRYVLVGEESSFANETTPTKAIRIASVETSMEGGNFYPELADTRFDAGAIPGAYTVSVSIELPIELENISHLLKLMFGTVDTYTIDDTTGVYEHIFCPVDFGSSLPSFTTDIAKDFVVERVIGGIMNRMRIEATAKELVVASFEWQGVKSKLVDVSSPTLPSPDFIPYHKGDVIIDGSARGDITAITLEMVNNVNYDDAYRITSSDGRFAKEFPIGGIDVTLEFDARFSTTDYIKWFYGSDTATEPGDTLKELSIKLRFIGKELELSSGTTHQELVIYLPAVVINDYSIPVSGRDRLIATISANANKGTAVVERYDGSTVSYESSIVIYLRNKVASP